MTEAIRVRLNNIDLVWLKDEYGDGPLAYPDHIDGTGNITLEHVMSNSYAHVFSDGTIKRYGQAIATINDLEGIIHDASTAQSSGSTDPHS